MQSALQERFSKIYTHNEWRDGESVSGGGSRLDRTADVREKLPLLLGDLGAKSLLDAGCGDWNWMSTLDLSGIDVRACDIVPEMIAFNAERFPDRAKFFVADLTTSMLPRVDMILCRTVLFHLSFSNIYKALENFKLSGSTWLLITTHPHHERNIDITDGAWRRLSMEREPFNLPAPIQLFRDGPGDDGYLGLWKIQE